MFFKKNRLILSKNLENIHMRIQGINEIKDQNKKIIF